MIKTKKLAVAFTIFALVVLGIIAVFLTHPSHPQPIGVKQVDSTLGGTWLSENDESFTFSVLANGSIRITYFNGGVQTIPPNYKGEIGGLQDFGPGIADKGGFIEYFKQVNSTATLTIVALRVSNAEAHLFIQGLNTIPPPIKLQKYKGYLYFFDGNSLTAVYDYKYIIYITWVREYVAQQQLIKLLNYLAN
ncbi:hypothetical protein B9Q11_01290 [Candidatus Marsarchaeota G2 archaeon ECH_B_SAG-F08]|uniref:Uncharacterized protein n=4 Tax=Candidatus Marsarchaeota TaxID=1978152 RepID=A0A2R6CD69_9ARCH|nr:MAG: hypothetical protein B9Q00_03150 [Candidatus Marsarchaeota G1 archaeon OSP_C]PSN99060.1 MAG: hypothetical protein B9Q11_01290 [Candidatus Marsarchaeota G2 archaeon ECH_B_SAG-F08]PSO05910.1 MAG: hypothetical protein B9Q13_00200 [Candidatus Marsarchaeota G2 archaeon ECH_B_SAG-G16]PSO08828.1 MAG: hypothetical protein B9Q04_03530 [Candidatus Marsarchaeota G2 archaeon BE_D]